MEGVSLCPLWWFPLAIARLLGTASATAISDQQLLTLLAERCVLSLINGHAAGAHIVHQDGDAMSASA
jgi:hypothetical protein